MRSFGYLGASFALAAVSAAAPSHAAHGVSSLASNDLAAAQKFGALDAVESMALSPDGTKVVIVRPDNRGRANGAIVLNLVSGKSDTAAYADGKPLRMTDCDWLTDKRMICKYEAVAVTAGTLAPFSRLVAVDGDGGNLKQLGAKDAEFGASTRQFDGDVLEWGADSSNDVLLSRNYVPTATTYQQVGSIIQGLGVDRIDTLSLDVDHVEPARPEIIRYLTDGHGKVRMKADDGTNDRNHVQSGIITYFYRPSGKTDWTQFAVYRGAPADPYPLTIDGTNDSVFVLKALDGRQALFRVALDGSMKETLAYANPAVDVDGVVTIGREGRVIGARYATDRRQVEYFDPAYKALAVALAKAIPDLPIIRFVSASADENKLIVSAKSDSDPGRYYLFDKATKHLDQLALARPELADLRLAHQQLIHYRNANGDDIPAYLTLPPGSDGKNLPAIVMPHGGPAARDEWGFDWFAQFFANRGFAVLQPNYRGSSGYGEAWFADNGFKSWKLAVSDVNDGGRWLVAQGIADPAKLAIVGWSYGGYAALQANVLDPDLFKAVVAVAPVTDLQMLKDEARTFTDSHIVAHYVGDGPQIEQGSPDRHADVFKAPVLLFHGDQDINVGVDESRHMDAALRHAGKSSRLVIYHGLQHQLEDAAARTDMLVKSDAFLRHALHL